MPHHNDGQKNTNIVQSDVHVKSGEMAMLLQKPFGRAISLTRVNNAWFIDRHDGKGVVAFIADYFEPLWPITGITTNDTAETGGIMRVDLADEVNGQNILIRVFSGLDRPYHITRIYLASVTDVDSVILLG
jgi:hypothetical protein